MSVRRIVTVRLATGLIAAATAAVTLAVTAAPAGAAVAPQSGHAGLRGTTEVSTAPGIASTLLGAGIVPLPVTATTIRVGVSGGLTLQYGFPITGGNPDLTGPSGDILHAGGIDFVSARGKRLEIGRFDIALAARKIYATQVNFAPARIPVLDLDLSRLHATRHGRTTVLSGIGLRLDPVAAAALNKTFGAALPTDGRLCFGTARLTLVG